MKIFEIPAQDPEGVPKRAESGSEGCRGCVGALYGPVRWQNARTRIARPGQTRFRALVDIDGNWPHRRGPQNKRHRGGALLLWDGMRMDSVRHNPKTQSCVVVAHLSTPARKPL